MTTPHIIQTVFEIVAIPLVIIAMLYEPAIAKWEDRVKEKVLKAFNERRKYRG